MHKTFETPEPIRVRVRNPAGEILVRAESTSRTEVVLESDDERGEDLISRARVELSGGVLHVELEEKPWLFGRPPEVKVKVSCPERTVLETRTASADLSVQGPIGGLVVASASGDVEVERVEGDANVATASGDVNLGPCAGHVVTNTASGDVAVRGALGGLDAHLVSGDLEAGRVDGGAKVSTVSGDIHLVDVGPGRVKGSSVSGDVQVEVRPGCDVWMDLKSLSGETTSELDGAEEGPGDRTSLVEVAVETVSGDIRVGRATVAATRTEAT